MYLHTKLSNPHYPPEIQAETTLINFTVTQAGLSDQLNVLVLGKERADLSEMSEVLVKQQTGFKIKMVLTQCDFLQFLNLNFASMASTRCHAASTQSMGPCERLLVA